MDEIQKKIEELQHRHAKVMQRKAGTTGQLQARKEELAVLVQEIRDAGYDPKLITQTRDQLRTDLLSELTKFEADLSEVEAALEGFPATR